ncbi:restriction system modified-DNA reader domain-containing protein [Actinomadura algeriensis]|uniref:RAMA domain-containing protein n=1 Tax=Actinomadura algeriensis TaxID=1679523 RepID=A0ABR9JMS2_9ACTN|nr:DUF4357 domain-containing protein [Actinomadura algeriensis]MBE1531738.1 hypothetical protein [Actinomadura algeriensis]
MRKIDVDGEVYAWLEKQVIGFDDNPNSVLRRLAGLDGTAASQDVGRGGGAADDEKDGELLPLIKAGRLQSGDMLVWRRPRKNETFRATVTERGCIRLPDGRVFTRPSPAAAVLVGQQTNGWDAWKFDGVKLNDLKPS